LYPDVRFDTANGSAGFGSLDAVLGELADFFEEEFD